MSPEMKAAKNTEPDFSIPHNAPSGLSDDPPGSGGSRVQAVTAPDSPLLETHPDPRSFIYKYILACFPVLLVIVSVFVRAFLEQMSRSLIPAIPGIFSSATPALTSISGISIFLVAPVGIFIVVAGIGWALRFTELWTSTALTLGLSILVGFILMGSSEAPPFSEKYIFTFLYWIAFLVQPFCILSAILVLAWTEKFRRSITYSIQKDNLVIRGGVWKHQEHLIPHHQIARIVLEQDLFGRLYNYGTVIPEGISRWGAETSFRGVGAGGQKDNIGAMIGFFKGREESSRNPLDCFFGIPDPKKAQELMKSLMVLPAAREEAQVAYLKQICDKI
jgi:hypothetical protein